MTASNGFNDDLLDAALGGNAHPPGDPALRAALRERTTGMLRVRRRVRRALLAASLVGCYAAGLLTAGLWLTQRADPTVGPNAVGPTAADAPSEPNTRPPQAPARSKLTRAEIVRRDADRRLLEQGDVQGATRRYDEYLSLASAEQLAISPGQDNWLLMALKDAKAKERDNERQQTN